MEVIRICPNCKKRILITSEQQWEDIQKRWETKKKELKEQAQKQRAEQQERKGSLWHIRAATTE